MRVTRGRRRFTRKGLRDQLKQTVVRHAEEVAGFEARLAAIVADRDAKLAGAERLMRDQHQRNAELEQENARLRADHIDVGVRDKQLDTANAANQLLWEELKRVRSELAEAKPVTVAPMQRDVDGPTLNVDLQKVQEGVARHERQQAQVRTLADALGSNW